MSAAKFSPVGTRGTCRFVRSAGFGAIPGSEYFSGTFISADHHLLKPEDAIYQAFFQKFGLKPEECLFIDDSAPNIEASENAGMAGIVFHGDAARLRRQLAERGIL